MKRVVLFLFLIVLMLALFGCGQDNTSGETVTKTVLEANTGSKGVTYKNITTQVTRVVDGDTIEVLLDGKKTSIRLLLIDTPETVKPRTPIQPWGKDASNFTKQLLTGKTVQLEMQSNLDKYGRGLAYVYIDGKSVEEQLILNGLARVAYIYIKNPPHLQEYRADEAKAKAQKLNIWSVPNYVQDNGFHPEVVNKAS